MKQCCADYLSEQFGGDADLMAEIYGEYVTSVTTKIAEAKAALAAQDRTTLDRIAHTIKGKGFPFAEGKAAYHNAAMNEAEYQAALEIVKQMKEEA